MKILVTNDDGIFAEEMWTLVNELKDIAQVVVVAPDREQSAIGTAVSLHQPIRIKRAMAIAPEVETYAVEGTPADSVILALSKLIKGKVNLVISGINQGRNLGNDVLISGTVGAAIQGSLHGYPAFAISVEMAGNLYLNNAARLAVLLAKKIDSQTLPVDIFLNINLPNLPSAQIKGIKVTKLADASHINTVTEGHDGKQPCYWLVRNQISEDTKNSDRETDIWAIEQGYISITPLHANLSNRKSSPITDSLCSELFQELRG